ncbi:MAG TPA: FxsA family protein [Actinomycetales bacterium]|nr:FxsA family protein [Actinomycetales bacterium]
MTGGTGATRAGGTNPGGRRGVWPWVLAAIVLLPVVELFGIITVADRIGGGWTLLLLLAAGAAGVLILSRGGPSTFRRVREASRAGRVPGGELADAFLTVVGGVLLLVPGFVTDVLALLCLVPPARWGARRVLVALTSRWASRKAVQWGLQGRGVVVRGTVIQPGTTQPQWTRTDEGVVEGKVLPPAPGGDDPPRGPSRGPSNRPSERHSDTAGDDRPNTAGDGPEDSDGPRP